MLALPVEGAVIGAEGRCGGAVGGAGGRTSGGEGELTQEPLVLAVDASHLVAAEGVVLSAPACAAPAAADGGAAGTGDEPGCTRHGWRRKGEKKSKTYHTVYLYTCSHRYILTTSRDTYRIAPFCPYSRPASVHHWFPRCQIEWQGAEPCRTTVGD